MIKSIKGIKGTTVTYSMLHTLLKSLILNFNHEIAIEFVIQCRTRTTYVENRQFRIFRLNCISFVVYALDSSGVFQLHGLVGKLFRGWTANLYTTTFLSNKLLVITNHFLTQNSGKVVTYENLYGRCTLTLTNIVNFFVSSSMG